MPNTSAQQLAVAVARLHRRLRQERDSELTPTQMAVLGTLSTQGPMTPGAIAAREHVRPPSMTRTVNCLVEDGLVERAPHPTDGRQIVVSLSALGRKVLDTERARRNQWLADRLEQLSAEERETLRTAAALMERLVSE
ncbi:DNA-binding MarR family transcriptional regulator [Mumia flava]|uniref:DNA-binding MarR family transcriptional regulator n=1 Tax=Mumia flava TaxID=1348852 RepID=A0A0B2BMB2_9ACTN|nr:MarR family transcriptional regulator [Mumia flava]PJJ56960.1 DNA-binding MarR family transcriptional regulator [Mumia flava]